MKPGAAKPLPGIAFDATLPWLEGFAYGLRQPCMGGEIRFHHATPAMLRSLAAALAQAAGLTTPPGQESPVLECARVIASWTTLLQFQSRIPVMGDAWVRVVDPSCCEVAFPAYKGDAVLLALRHVGSLAHRQLRGGSAVATPEEAGALHRALRAHRPAGVNAFSIALAAHNLGMPWCSDANGMEVLGTGAHVRWMHSTITDRTPGMGMKLAASKSRTASVLRAAGLPGALHEFAASADEAVTAAGRIGWPVVVKPDDMEQGAGVAAGLESQAEVREAFRQAREVSSRILVERHGHGWTHRFTVSHGRVVRVVRRMPGGVTGDGVHDIRRLVEMEAATPLGIQRMKVMGKPGVTLDAEATELLARAGLGADSVPESGRFVRMRRRDNFNAGGTNVDLALDAVHADNRRLAVDAAMSLRLDIAGIDLIIEDASVSWLVSGALICEVNAMPQLYAAEDDPIYERLLLDIMGEGPCRIPARLEIHARPPNVTVALAGMPAWDANGLSCAEGLYVDGRRVTAAFPNTFAAARALLARPDVRGALCLMDERDVLRHGLPVDRWDSVQRVGASALEPAARKRLEWMTP
ncbi:MAG: acetate--CoA ligase family protein [Burkholderiales bacterium]|nr:acetate--CoA ligase family protein [Burkholderiales bacterium]